jgi:hypothetical protein
MPSRGHVSAARANAAEAASSATSQSPVIRMSVATTRAQSDRYASRSAAATPGAGGASPPAPGSPYAASRL